MLTMILGPDLDTVVDDSSYRMDPKSPFSQLVIDYMWHEWGVEFFMLPKERRREWMDLIKSMEHLGVSEATSKIMSLFWQNGLPRWRKEELGIE